MLDSLNCLSQSACCWRNVQGLWGGVWSLEFGVWRRCRCFFSVLQGRGRRAEVARGPWAVGGKSIACPRVECFFPTPKRSQAPCPRDFQAWASCTNRQRLDPRAQNQNHPRNQLPAADWRSSPIPQRRTPTAPHTTDNFPFVFIPPPRKQSPVAALRTCAASGPPISHSHAGPPSRAAPHACTTGPVRPGRKPSPAVPVPRHGRKRGPLRCVDQVPRAG